MAARKKGISVATGSESGVRSVRRAEVSKDSLLSNLITDGLVTIVEVPQGYLHKKLQNNL